MNEDINSNRWGDKPYNSLNYYLRDKFNEKVFKISIDGGFSCPNRDGKISKGGCIFCSEKGSGDYAGDRNKSIREQFIDIEHQMNKKWKKGKYIMYFQAYTNTYAQVDELRKKYQEALEVNENVVGIAIATRPDCLNEDVLNLLDEFSKKTFLWIELGLQTIHEKSAEYINRGYDLKLFEEKINELNKRDIKVVAHHIIGIPGESKDEILASVKYLSETPIWGIKFHLLHVMKNTKLADEFFRGKFNTLSKENYIEIVCKSIGMLREDIVIHRITGDAPRNLLISPMWSLKKWEVLNGIHNYLDKEKIYQGLYYNLNK